MEYKGHILVVDDEKNIRSSLKGILSDEGYMISTAEDGKEAIDIIESTSPNLVLLDIWIPGMDGIKTLSTIKNSQPDIEIIMMSGHGSIDTAVKATKLGAFDFIEKPFSLESVLLTVEKALESQKINKKSFQKSNSHKLIGNSRQVNEINDCIQELSSVNIKSFVLIEGEDGAGKEIIAKIIHEKSFKGAGHFIKINCQNLTTPVLKSYLYSNQDSDSDTINYKKFDKSTIYFHNINETPSKVLHKISTFITNISKNSDSLNMRVLTSSNVNLRKNSDKGNFPKKLCSKICKVTIKTTPLRKRKEDIPLLVSFYVNKYSSKSSGKVKILPSAMDILRNYNWPGNVFELKNVIEQLLAVSYKDEISAEDISPFIEDTTTKNRDSREFSSVKEAEKSWEKEFIINKLREIGWEVKKVAKSLGIDEHDLEKKIKFHKITITKSNKPAKHLQRTLKRSVVLCGQGLHSGIKTGLILSPLPLGSGIIFEDISTGERIPAFVDNVESTAFATSLKKNHIRVKTIEHIMAVLHMYRINNLLIKVGDEIPIMDGSAIDFCQLVEDGEVCEQNGFLDEIVIKNKIIISDGDGKNERFISIEPFDGYCVEYRLNYPPPIGEQKYQFQCDSEISFKKNIAPARTFGLLKDFEKLEEMGLASGGKLSNIILVDHEKVINTELRFKDEFARHKILDITGDVYLLGKPIRGKIKACMTGHSQNIELIKKVKEQYGL